MNRVRADCSNLSAGARQILPHSVRHRARDVEHRRNALTRREFEAVAEDERWDETLGILLARTARQWIAERLGAAVWRDDRIEEDVCAQ